MFLRALPYAAITAVAMLATDLYLPALPAVGRALGASIEATQASLSAFLLGLAASQLPWGRVCDRYGARTSLLVGLAIFVGASLGCVAASSMPVLVAMRALEGIGAGATTVIVPVLVRRDFASGEAAVALSWIGIAEAIVPAAGPVLGALLLVVADYRASFAIVAGLALILGVAILRREPRPPTPDAPTESGSLGARFTRLVLGHAFGLGALIAFVGSAPQLLALHLDAGAGGFAILQAFGVAGFALVASTTGPRIARFGAEASVVFGIGLQLLGGLAIAAADALDGQGYPLVVLGWVLF